jgi:hypothetical protein
VASARSAGRICAQRGAAGAGPQAVGRYKRCVSKTPQRVMRVRVRGMCAYSSGGRARRRVWDVRSLCGGHARHFKGDVRVLVWGDVRILMRGCVRVLVCGDVCVLVLGMCSSCVGTCASSYRGHAHRCVCGGERASLFGPPANRRWGQVNRPRERARRNRRPLAERARRHAAAQAGLRGGGRRRGGGGGGAVAGGARRPRAQQPRRLPRGRRRPRPRPRGLGRRRGRYAPRLAPRQVGPGRARVAPPPRRAIAARQRVCVV